jgi:hypothetical protein
MAAGTEAAGARKGLAEDQAGAVVERLEDLGVELLEAAALSPGLGVGAFRRPTPGGSLANDAVEPAARDELRVPWCITHRLSPFLGLLTI